MQPEILDDSVVLELIRNGALIRRQLGFMQWYLVQHPAQRVSTTIVRGDFVIALIKEGFIRLINIYQNLDDVYGSHIKRNELNPDGKLLVILTDDNCNDPRWAQDYWQNNCCFIHFPERVLDETRTPG